MTPKPDLLLLRVGRLLEDGALEEAEQQALTLLDSAAVATRQEAAALLGQIYLVQDRFDEAMHHFGSAAKTRGLASDWYGLMLASARAKQFGQADQALARALKASAERDPAGPSRAADTDLPLSPGWIRYFFVRALCDAGAADRASTVLNELRDAYADLGSTEESVTAAHHLPTFADMLDAVEVVARAKNARFDYATWLKKWATQLDEAGRRSILSLLETLQNELFKAL